MRRAYGLITVFCLSMTASAIAATPVPYTGKQYRDPFIDKKEVKVVDESATIQQSIESMNVQGILYNMENPVAIIDGRIYRIGNRIGGGGQVVKIEKGGVTVAQGGKQFTIKQTRGKIR